MNLLQNNAKTFDVTSYLKRSKGLKRDEMPQIDMNQFEESLEEMKKYFTIYEVFQPALVLKPTQSEINMSKVEDMLSNTDDRPLTMICSNDNYFVDGHHRHVKQLILNRFEPIRCYVFVDLDIDALMSMLRRFADLLLPSKSIKESIETKLGCDEYHLIMERLVNDEYSEKIIALQTFIYESIDDLTKLNHDSTMRFASNFLNAKELMNFEKNILAKSLTNSDDQALKSNITEDFGSQGPEAVPGIGPVILPNGETKGSGDIPGVVGMQVNKIHDEDEEDEKITEEQVERCDVHFESALGIEDLKKCRTKPTMRKYKQIDTPFSCNTLEGITTGKAGDYLVVGVDNEIYPVDQDIFIQTYEKLEE